MISAGIPSGILLGMLPTISQGILKGFSSEFGPASSSTVFSVFSNFHSDYSEEYEMNQPRTENLNSEEKYSEVILAIIPGFPTDFFLLVLSPNLLLL